jgi:hypothetical protein
MTERIRRASKSLRESRAARTNQARFKFWFETKSGNQMMTEFMDQGEATLWLRTNQQHIVGMQIIERMSREEAMRYVGIKEDEE